jgi:hypothetical protein
MLEYPPCPVCGGELPLREFFKEWDPASKHGEVNPALECPSCFARLRPRVLRANFLAVAAIVANIALLFAASRIFGRSDLATLVVGIAFMASFLWIQYSLVRRLVSWREVVPGEPVRFMLPTRAQREKEEAETRIELDAARAAAAREAAEYPPWNCTSCGEENPGRFELCWKCRSSPVRREESGDQLSSYGPRRQH